MYVVFHWMLSSFQEFMFLVWSLSLSLTFGEDLVSGWWDIKLLIFWGRLPLDVVFVSQIFDFGIVPELKFKIWSVVVEIFQFWYFEVVLHWMLSSFQEYFILVWSNELDFKIWGRSDIQVLNLEVVLHRMLSFSKDLFNLDWLAKLKFKIWVRSEPRM